MCKGIIKGEEVGHAGVAGGRTGVLPLFYVFYLWLAALAG